MTPWTRKYARAKVVRVPIGHGDGTTTSIRKG